MTEAEFNPDEFRAELRNWLREAVPQSWRDNRGSMSERETVETRRQWSQIVWSAGYSGLTYPVEYGGRGLPPIASTIFYEEVARAHAPEELNRLGRNLAGPAILAHGTEEQKKKYIPKILDETEIWCEGFSEPDAGSDLAAVRTFARREDDRFLINGSKIWTSLAHLARRCYLLAKTDQEAPRHHNLTVFLLDMDQPGVEVVPIKQITGESMFNQVFFTDAVAKQGEILGEMNDGWRLGTIAQGGFRASGAEKSWHHYAEIQEALDQFERCCRERNHSLDVVREFRERLELLRWHINRSSGIWPESSEWFPVQALSVEIKIYWSALAQEVIEAGLNSGCRNHRDYWRYHYLESRPATVYGGSVQIQRNVVADQVLKLRKA